MKRIERRRVLLQPRRRFHNIATRGLAVCLVALVLALSALTALAAPTDVVPRGDVAYDLLGSLAAAGRLPGYTLSDFARGDRLYTRGEIAHIIAQMPPADSATSDPGSRFAAAERVLRSEFAEELKHLQSETAPNSATPARVGDLTGQIKARALTDPAAGTATLRFAGSLPLGRDGYAVLSASNYRYEWSANGGKDYPVIETAFARVNTRFLDVSLGRRPIRWGPGYSGPLLFSDAAASLPMLQLEKGFRLPGSLGRHIGPLYFTEFASTFTEDDVPEAPPDARGTRRYVEGRRLETNGTGRWTLSLAEAFKSTRLPDPLWTLVLPYYIYQNNWTSTSEHRLLGFLPSQTFPDSSWFNYLADVSVSYRAGGHGTQVYGDLVLDDLKTAFLGFGQNTQTPRKIGEQIGVHLPDLDGRGRFGAWIEYTNIDPETYTHESIANSWQAKGLPLGFPYGPNARVLFGRLDARLSSRVTAALEGTVRRRNDRARPDPDVDMVGGYASYDLSRNAFLGARVGHLREASPGVAATTQNRLEVSAGLGF
jgi:hypothetical protein